MMRAVLILAFAALASAAAADSGSRKVDVRMETALGTIALELNLRDAPITAANFLRYVDAGHFVSGRFHRTVKPHNQPNNAVKIEVIQGGVSVHNELSGFNPISLERTSLTGIRHKNGTISMARIEPDSATSDFFICIGNQPELDFGGKRNPDGQGFAAFGRVIGGMDVVRRIQQSSAEGQTLTPPIDIRRIVRLPSPFERQYE